MRKLKLFSVTILTFVVFAGIFNINAQTRISVKSLTLNFQSNATDGEFSMRTINLADGTETVYGGRGSYSLPLFYCDLACNLPNSFNTNGFQGYFGSQNRFGFYWAFDKLVYFYVTQVTSDTIVLRPTIRRKPRAFSISGATEIRGRVEVTDMNGIVAFDDNVVLKGDYTAGFINMNVLDGRKVKFTRISYNLNQATN